MQRLLGPALLSFVLVGAGAGCRKHHHNPAVSEAQAAALPSTSARAGGGGGGGGGGGFKSGFGMNRWKNAAVYVDGQPVGVLEFGELPVGLKPIWVTEEHSAEIEPGSHSSGIVLGQARRYRFTDYLKAVGVDVSQVKEFHLMGPKTTEITVVKGSELRSKKGEGFQFRFGALTRGKPLPVVPGGFGNGVHSDKIGSAMVYIHKKPPEVRGDQGMFLDGKEIDGVPYYGEPMRGGVRVYVDDRLAFDLKRNKLGDTSFDVGPDGHSHWKLWPVLQKNGIDTQKIVEGWTIADDRRQHRFSRAELEQMSFAIGEQGSNEILLGPDKVRASALAFHSHALKPSDLPVIRPEEQ